MLRAAGLIAGLVLLTAADPPSPVQKAFSSTIVSTYPDGRVAKMWMNPSGTYTSMGRRHDRHEGHWKLKGDKVCFYRSLGHYCTLIPTDNAFTTKAITGETIQVRLTPGREGESSG